MSIKCIKDSDLIGLFRNDLSADLSPFQVAAFNFGEGFVSATGSVLRVWVCNFFVLQCLEVA